MRTALAFTLMLLCGIHAPCAPPAEALTINGVRLSPEKVQAIQKQYGLRMANGDYWYDRRSGAWGYVGGPAVGQVHPFLELGGALKASASNGHTGVFINGRELHILDVRALQQITVVMPGRYWCDARGNLGFEGGPALINLYALAAAAQQRGGGVRREGILSTYDKTGAVVLGR